MYNDGKPLHDISKEIRFFTELEAELAALYPELATARENLNGLYGFRYISVLKFINQYLTLKDGASK